MAGDAFKIVLSPPEDVGGFRDCIKVVIDLLSLLGLLFLLMLFDVELNDCFLEVVGFEDEGTMGETGGYLCLGCLEILYVKVSVWYFLFVEVLFGRTTSSS